MRISWYNTVGKVPLPPVLYAPWAEALAGGADIFKGGPGMPVFGIKMPEKPELFSRAAEFCRSHGLRFMEIDASSPLPQLTEGLELLPAGRGLSLRMGRREDMDKFLSSLSAGQPVLLEAEGPEELEKLALYVNHWLNRQSAAGELWDVYDGERRLTGRVHPRGEELAAGDYHLVVHVWIRDGRGRFLLTKRSPNKGYGGMWESPGGAARAGDDSLSACLREIKEETGLELEPGRGKIVKSYRGEGYFCDVWLFHQDFDLEDVVLQEGETCDCMSATAEDILRLRREGLFVPFLDLSHLADKK